MPRWLVDPKAVKKIAMKDGAVYRPSASGVVSLSARHEAEMERSGSRHSFEEGEPLGPRLGVTDAGGWDCPTCRHVNWEWQQTCGRCGEALS